MTPLLEKPLRTFDHRLGDTDVKGFLGAIDGQEVAVFVCREGEYAGQSASSSVPSPPTSCRSGGLSVSTTGS